MYENNKQQELIEGVDFYFNEDGFMVFTQLFHIKRGYCCENDCKHCPYTVHPSVPFE
ncbi:DUF5522 domain-containing protein [Fluviispira sanaruensis]|uniref:Uncharacterized protein n=1 Tax=Fluviispira sanaruensis TaxID=2493639 RepID=A0A4P2VUF5_FLUSA|nr:DUF5522 domain-containing protein [Fluviispira sanaruensis]BBH53115.1 hypothetical protein JCM31447_15580 [Fluviispira sanaruensis]